jgi:LysM repeat protein
MKIRNVVLAAGLGGLMLLALVFTLAAAPGTTQAAPAADGSFITVTVKAGDSLSKYRRWYGVFGSALLASNKFKDPNLIFPGQVVTIPVVKSFTPSLTTPFYYVVQAVSVLTTSNPGVSSPNAIFAGQNIFIPIIYGALPMPVTAVGTAVPTPTSTTKPGASATPGPTATTAAGNFIQVTVHRGESFITYVSRYGVNRRRLRAANPKLADPNVIFPGQILIVPVPVSFSPSRTTPFFYVVQGGETAAGVAAKFEMTAATLTAANPDVGIVPGVTVLVPAGPHAYTVKAGDTLTGIAAKYGTTVDALVTANNLANANIVPGQVIQVPVQLDHAPLPFN